MPLSARPLSLRLEGAQGSLLQWVCLSDCGAAMKPTLAEQVEALQAERDALEHLCGTVLATLRLPANYVTLHSAAGVKELQRLADGWWEQFQKARSSSS